MKKVIVILAICLLSVGIFVGCGNKKTVFTESGLSEIHITSLVVSNDVTKKTSEVTDADGVNKFLDVLNTLEIPKEEKTEEHSSGCNVPGQNKYYIELKDGDGNIVGDVIISKKGGILVNNFENKYTKEVLNESIANELDGVLEKNINS